MDVFIAQMKLIILVLFVLAILLGIYFVLAKHATFESVYQSVVGAASVLLKRGKGRNTGHNVRRPTPQKTIQNRSTGRATPGAVPMKKAYRQTITYCDYELQELSPDLQTVVNTIPLPLGYKPLMIGVAEDCEIHLEETNHEYISHYHAAIGMDAQGIYLKNNNSTNGIYDKDKQFAKLLDLQENEVFYLSKKYPFRVVYKG